MMTQLASLLALLIATTPGFVLPVSSAAANCTVGDCLNGGVCNNFTASPPCICPLPYIGSYCAAAANYCSTLQPEKGITSFPVCLNNGTCKMGYVDPYFNCSCAVIESVNVYGGCTCVIRYNTGLRCNDTLVTMTKGTSASQVVESISDCEYRCIHDTSTISTNTSKGSGSETEFLSTSSKIAIGVLVPLILLAIGGVLLYLCYFKNNSRHQYKKNSVGCLGTERTQSEAKQSAYASSEPSSSELKANGVRDKDIKSPTLSSNNPGDNRKGSDATSMAHSKTDVPADDLDVPVHNLVPSSGPVNSADDKDDKSKEGKSSAHSDAEKVSLTNKQSKAGINQTTEALSTYRGTDEQVSPGQSKYTEADRDSAAAVESLG